MRKFLSFFIILSLIFGFIKPAFALESPDLSQIQFATDNTQTTEVLTAQPVIDLKLVVLNTVSYQITAEEAAAGKKFRAFNNQFVFQIDEKSFSAPATLELKEYALGPDSALKAPEGFQFASRIYEFNLKTADNVEFVQPFWFSVKYLMDDYFRKTMYYFDEQMLKWQGMKSLVNNSARKIVSKTNFTYAKVAILEDLNIMSQGTASWYKYKNCNCAASPDYPKGTKLKVTNIDNGKSIVVIVNDWGPDRSIHPDRVIDLDVVAFKQIAKISAGLCKVKVELAEPIKTAIK